jgi:opacity protein-like surface antigen
MDSNLRNTFAAWKAASALGALVLMVHPLSAQIQTGTNSGQNPQTYNSEVIDVDGYVSGEENVSDSELESIKSTAKKYKTDNKLFKEKTKALNQVTNEAEKIGENAEEKIMAQVEMKKAENKAMTKIQRAEAKLKCLTDETLRNTPECKEFYPGEDKVTTQASAPAPAPVVETKVEASGPQNAFEEIKLIPFVGVNSYQGKKEKLETEVAAGVNLESNVNERFSMGVGFRFEKFNTDDYANNNQFNNPYFNSYTSIFGLNSRNIAFQNYGFDFYGKFFITRGQRFRPYIGGGVGYNRMSLKYEDSNQTFSFDPRFNYGREEFSTSFLSAALSAGSEVLITQNIGIIAELKYSRGFGSSNSSSTVNSVNYPDQKRLEELADDIIEANTMSLFLGTVITF